MKIKSFKKLKDNRYKIILENEDSVILYDEIILKYNLLIYKQIEKSEIEKLKKENDSLECYYKAIKYLAYKDRCRKEIENYLKRFSFNSNDIETTIKRLENEKILNQNKYLNSYINDQVNLTNNGPLKIQNKLVSLGFKKTEIEEALENISKEIWKEKLEKIILKKIKANKKDSVNKIKEKILYSCLNEGFNKEEILNILYNFEFPTNNQALEKEARKQYIKLTRKYQDKELYYQLKGKLLAKGFLYNDINDIITKLKQE